MKIVHFVIRTPPSHIRSSDHFAEFNLIHFNATYRLPPHKNGRTTHITSSWPAHAVDRNVRDCDVLLLEPNITEANVPIFDGRKNDEDESAREDVDIPMHYQSMCARTFRQRQSIQSAEEGSVSNLCHDLRYNAQHLANAYRKVDR